MAITAAAVTVTTTATLLSTANDPGSQSIAVQVPTGGATVYLGGAGVTTAQGYPLAAGEKFAVDLTSDDRLYGIVAADTQAVNVFRQGV